MKETIITIFGGTGFIGSQIVRELAQLGYIIRVAEKHPKKADRLKFNGMVGQVQPYACDYTKSGIETALDGAYYVVNCTGILLEKGKRTFMGTHRDLPEMIAKACAKKGVKQFVHISALGIEKNQSDYAKSKLAGEKAIQKAFDKITILRPSIVFGPEDSFFNMFAGMAQILPALPLIGGGHTKFQPVYVGDVADAVANAIKMEATGIYELGGSDIQSFRELLQTMKNYTGQSVKLISLPVPIAKIQAVFMSILPTPPLTLDQIKSLQHDNIVNDNAQTLTDLDITPTSMAAILPRYLSRFKQ
jgi:NADH dehydrogenase